MAKYRINQLAIEDIDCSILIEAVERYLNAEKYPTVEVMAAILGIDKVEEE